MKVDKYIDTLEQQLFFIYLFNLQTYLQIKFETIWSLYPVALLLFHLPLGSH